VSFQILFNLLSSTHLIIQTFYILYTIYWHVWGVCVTNNNRIWIGCLDLLPSSIIITLNYNQFQQLTINDYPRLAPILTGLRVSSLRLWLIWFWFTSHSLLVYERRMPNDGSLMNESVQVKVKVTLRLTVSQSVSLGDRILIAVWQLRSCFCGAPSLTRGRVCLLYMLLVLASADFPGSKSLGTRDHILLSQVWHYHFRRLLRLAGSRWRPLI
jgi:hypothetical protein